jgi:general secretion pathway protein L
MELNLKDRLTGLKAAGPRRMALRLPRGWPESGGSVYWYAPGRAGGEHTGRADALTQLPDFVRSATVHVWTPAAETLLTHATIPTRSRARILQALPYALEDQLLDEPEQLHFAYVREDDGALAVGVTRRARLNRWLEVLRGAGIRTASLSPAQLALPLSSDAWALTFTEDELWVRTGPYAGFVALADYQTPPPLLVTALREAAEQNRAPNRLTILRPPGAVDANAWSTALGLPVSIDHSDFWDSANVPALNLMQSDFSAAGQLNQTLRPLRPALIMLAIWLVGTLAMDITEWARLRHDYHNATAEMGAVFRKNFPETKTVLDPAAQMQKSLEALQSRGGGPADLLPLLARVTPALKAQSTIKLNGIKYGERNLTLELMLPDYQALDTLKNSLQSTGLDAEVLAANKRADDVEARLRVQPSGAKIKPRLPS